VLTLDCIHTSALLYTAARLVNAVNLCGDESTYWCSSSSTSGVVVAILQQNPTILHNSKRALLTAKKMGESEVEGSWQDTLLYQAIRRKIPKKSHIIFDKRAPEYSVEERAQKMGKIAGKGCKWGLVESKKPNISKTSPTDIDLDKSENCRGSG